jgi:transketolase
MTSADWYTRHVAQLDDAAIEELRALARRGRWLAVKTVADSKAGHVGGPLSAMDLLTVLYFHTLRIRPHEPDWPDRDRFILSKGHSAIGLYVVLALRGFFEVDELASFDKSDSRLQGHPDMMLLPGLDASTGSLGQGLSLGLGMALGAKLSDRPPHVWVMLGDGELQEGMVWEAVHVAARYRLDNLTAIVDLNGLQQYGWTSAGPSDRGDRGDPWTGVDLAQVFRAFGWRVIELDGHDMQQIIAAYELASAAGPEQRPTVLLAHTVKGRGLSFAEGNHAWHTGIANEDQLARARTELQVATEPALS